MKITSQNHQIDQILCEKFILPQKKINSKLKYTNIYTCYTKSLF